MPGEEMPGGVTVFAAGQGGCQRVEVGGVGVVWGDKLPWEESQGV